MGAQHYQGSGGLRQIIGGNISEYTEGCEKARRDAYRQQVQMKARLRQMSIVRYGVNIKLLIIMVVSNF